MILRDTLFALARDYLDAITPLAPRAGRIVNKDLGCYRHLGLIDVILPKARVIHCRRDPVDTCLSCYMEPLRPASVPYASDLGHLGAYYGEYRRLMRHWREVMRVDMLEIDYEAIVAEPEPMSRRLIEFCGLPWDDACLRFHEGRRAARTLSYDQVRRPVYGTSVGRAERFGAALDPLRKALGPEFVP